MQRMLFLSISKYAKIGCLILHYREGSFSCRVARARVKTSSLAEMLTGSEKRDDRGVRLHEVTRYGIFPYTSKRLVHTYPNSFENGDFFPT